MKTTNKIILAAAIALGVTNAGRAAKLRHPKMQMLDHVLNQTPKGIDDIVCMKKLVSKVQDEVAQYKGRHSDITRGGEQEEEFLTRVKDDLLTPSLEFLGLIHDFHVVVEPLVKESLAPLREDGIDPRDAFILYPFFGK